ncbi:MAG: quinone-dependent dihydroorotate dehydrogenase [Patescibacteria group bacterium]|nr:quinone-dependent dihydroorotate dehydrogenase [Patescibacteria group bacterium]
MNRMYKWFLKPILFRFDPESVHDVFITLGEMLGQFAISRRIISLFYGYRKQGIAKEIDGIKYRIPVLLAAGFDYNGRLTGILPHVAFGGEEVGSVTARPCAGNSRPRMKRLPRSGSIIVNKGLRNDGVDKIIERLKSIRRDSDYVIGISIARTNDAISVPMQAGIDDYAYSFKRLNEEEVGDFYTINISCPNAFGGEAFTTPELLTKLLGALRSISCHKPVYVKMPINMPWFQFDSLLQVILAFKINGVVIGNLNKDYSYLREMDRPKKYEGGLSGRPCMSLSNELIRKTKEKYGGQLTIIGVGGIMSPNDAIAKFQAGADLVQLITGMIYDGPGLMKRICRELESRQIR